MKTTGIFTVHKYEIKFKKYNEPIYLIPFGDIHRSSPHCDIEKWHEFLAWAKTKERCYFIGMGDYDDLSSSSERHLLNDPKIHDSTMRSLEKFYDYNTKILAKELSFMKGRLIGMIEGNHYSRFQDGSNTTQRLCGLLDTKYLGVTSFIQLVFSYCETNSHSVIIWAHHGLGAGRTVGGSINKVEQMEKVCEADIYLMGHDHRKSISMLNKFALSTKVGKHQTVNIKKIILARTGSFLRGYVQDEPSYIADSGMSPTDLGTIKIELTPKRKDWLANGKKFEHRYIDLHGGL